MSSQYKSKEKKLKIAFLSQYSPDDRKASSGTNYKIAEELSKIGNLQWIQIKSTFWGKSMALIAGLWNRLSKKRLLLRGTYLGAKIADTIISKDALDECDVIAAFFCMPVLANLQTDKPIVYFTDATAPAMLDYYPYFSNLFQLNRKQFVALEKKAMDKATAIVISSAWAAKSATSEILNQPQSKVHIVEFGANIDVKDISRCERVIKDELNILFLGVEWERKGGDIAVEAVKWLNDHGIVSKLHIVGIKELPEKFKDLTFIINHGFLNKNNPEDYKQLIDILFKMNCMLLPTKAECSAIAFAEASANGLPVFTHDTGGVSNYVYNGKNGYMLPLGSTGEDFGKKIKEVVESGELFKLSEGGRNIYHDRLNWNVWGKKVDAIIKSIM